MRSIYDNSSYKKVQAFFNEPDVLSTCAFGLPIYLRRNFQKAWCGYVGIPPHHPHFGLNCSSRIPTDKALVKLGEQSPLSIMLEYLKDDQNSVSLAVLYDCHGGITWAADHCPGLSPDGFWWFGFDCSHYNDFSVKDAMEELFTGEYWRHGEYRDINYALKSARGLASQLSDYTTSHKEPQ